MNTSKDTSLRYQMGNAGDLLKHGVLAEFVRWRCDAGERIRFLDLFAGLPFNPETPPEVISRIQGLDLCALTEAQPDIGEGRYLGSTKLVQHLGQRFGNGKVEVYAADADPGRNERLAAEGLQSLEALPAYPDAPEGADGYDAYTFLSAYIDQAEAQDLVLIDPYADFLLDKAETVIPQISQLAERAAILLFALNGDPYSPDGERFDALLDEHLPGAVIMTVPPLRSSKIEGEKGYYADVILASHALGEDGYAKDALLTRLDIFARQLGRVLGRSDRSRGMLRPRVLGKR
ncbi:MAG: hypothetical protein OXC42_08630 [Gammaproteobacteria bacterium]|nr:hypothetical protein [Gammaproteobacteria bacterium]